MAIRILETYTGGTFPISDWLPVETVNLSGQASLPIMWLAGPSEVLPISTRSGGGFSRQVITGPTVAVDVRDSIIDYIIDNLEIDEAGVLASLGVATRVLVNAWQAIQDFGLIDLSTEQLYVDRSTVETTYEKAYPNGVGRKTQDLKALGAREKGKSKSTLKNEYGDTPNSEGLIWREFAAAYHVNLADLSNDKDAAIEAARVYINQFL